ncbi:MAG: acyltransferase family protein [Nocardioidaceae bacterium]|nr:acyltransferase family protein [Nocardioidaceae bacterium]
MATLRTEAAPLAPTTRALPTRDPWFDNAKMALVTLVVVGHSWTLLPHRTGTDTAYDFLYAWHVPAFVLVTGYLSRRFAWTPAKLGALVRTVAVPYLVFEAALAWFRYQVGGVALDDLFTDPHWPMWYLAALFFWRLATPAFRALSAGSALLVAVTLSLLSGLWDGTVFDHARILGLLPFFVLGLVLADADWQRLRRVPLPFGVAGLGAVAALAWWSRDRVPTEWLYYRSPYGELEPDPVRAMAIRLGVLAVGLLGALSFFVLVPRVRGWFATLGAATLVVYLFHGFFVLTAQYQGFGDWTAEHVVLGFAVTTVAAIGLALALAAPPVARVLSYAVDPVGKLGALTRRAGGGPSAPSAGRPSATPVLPGPGPRL